MHINISLTDATGDNVFAEADADDGLSLLCRLFIAGLLAHHVGMTALCAPTVNAYKRLRPGLLAGVLGELGL